VSTTADLCAESIFDVDFALLRGLGVRGLLIDVDNTLVEPGGSCIDPGLADHLRVRRSESGIGPWALASNARRDLSPLAAAIGADVVKARGLCAKPRRAFYLKALATLGLPPHEVAMIGDKVLHDIAPAARLGIRTVLVRPRWPDQLVDRVLMRRQRETRAAWVREAWGLS
jgi:putative phosphatase